MNRDVPPEHGVKKRPARRRNVITEKDVEGLKLPIDVKRHANTLIMGMAPEVLSCSKKNYVLLYVITAALKASNRYRPPADLAAMFNVRPKNVQGIINDISLVAFQHPGSTSVAAPSDITAEDLLPDFADHLPQLERSSIASIKRLIAQLVGRSPTLRLMPPQKLAAGALALFLEIKGIRIDDDEFGETIGVTGWSAMLDTLRSVHVRAPMNQSPKP
jgi:hypothetical protein